MSLEDRLLLSGTWIAAYKAFWKRMEGQFLHPSSCMKAKRPFLCMHVIILTALMKEVRRSYTSYYLSVPVHWQLAELNSSRVMTPLLELLALCKKPYSWNNAYLRAWRGEGAKKEEKVNLNFFILIYAWIVSRERLPPDRAFHNFKSFNIHRSTSFTQLRYAYVRIIKR